MTFMLIYAYKPTNNKKEQAVKTPEVSSSANTIPEEHTWENYYGDDRRRRFIEDRLAAVGIADLDTLLGEDI